MAIFAWTVAALLALGIGIYIIARLVSVVRRQPKVFGLYMKLFRRILLAMSLCAMWIFMGWFVHLTLRIRERAGKNNKDREWTFGQVLALATWVPFFVEFAYQWLETDPAEDNDSKSTKTKDGVEMEQPGVIGGRGEFQRLDSWRTGDD